MEKIPYFINIEFGDEMFTVGDGDYGRVDNEYYEKIYDTNYLSTIIPNEMNVEYGYQYYLRGYIQNNKFYVERVDKTYNNDYDYKDAICLSKEEFNKIAKSLIEHKLIVNKIKNKKPSDSSKIELEVIRKNAEETGRIFGIDLDNSPRRYKFNDVKDFTYFALKYIYEHSQFGYGSDNDTKKTFIDGINKFLKEIEK